MKISFSPQVGAVPLALAVTGDAITIDGQSYNFAALSEGDVLPYGAVECPWLVSDVTREAGRICLTLILPHDAAPIVVTEDGPVVLPVDPFAEVGNDD